MLLGKVFAFICSVNASAVKGGEVLRRRGMGVETQPLFTRPAGTLEDKLPCQVPNPSGYFYEPTRFLYSTSRPDAGSFGV